MKAKIFLTIIITVFFARFSTADEGGKKRTVHIKTNAQCEDCKNRLESILNYEKGIIYADLDVETKILEIKYNSKRINIDEIRKKISEIGYSADDVEAEKGAQEKLPECCRPGGH